MKDQRADPGSKKKAPKRTASRPAKKAPSRQRSVKSPGTASKTTTKKKGSTRSASVEESSPAVHSGPRARRFAPKSITEEQRRALVSERAYFKAQERGFVGGDPLQDWCEAEAEIDALILRGSDGD